MSKARNIAFLLAGLGLVSAAVPAGEPASKAASAYKLAPGPFKTGETEMVLHDEARKKDLPIRVRFPKDSTGLLPLVVFSHGAGGSDNAFPELTDHWAGYGYVVILPTHSDSIALRRKNGEDLSGLRTNPKSLISSVQPTQRLADVKLILDSLSAIEEKVPTLRDAQGKGRIDRERIGVGGHSAGAMTASLALGVKARVNLSAQPQAVGDKRIKAGLIVSGQGVSNKAFGLFTKDSWSEMDKPMMVITGSLDKAALTNETPASRQEAFELAKPGDKYLLFIEGATHSSYAGKAASALLGERPTTDLKLITDVTACGTLAFWDAYLKGEDAAKTYLAGDGLTAFGEGKVTFKRK